MLSLCTYIMHTYTGENAQNNGFFFGGGGYYYFCCTFTVHVAVPEKLVCDIIRFIIFVWATVINS